MALEFQQTLLSHLGKKQIFPILGSRYDSVGFFSYVAVLDGRRGYSRHLPPFQLVLKPDLYGLGIKSFWANQPPPPQKNIIQQEI